MKRDIYIVHGNGFLGATKVVFDETTPGDIILVVGSEVTQAIQCAIEETNIDPLDMTVIRCRNEYKTVTIPIDKVRQGSQQTVEEFFRELWGDDVYDTEALSRDW